MSITVGVLSATFGNPYRGRRAHDAISLLEREDGRAARSLGTAFDRFINGMTLADEKSWVGKIESVRKELLVSPEQITVVDYGINPRVAQTAAEANGRAVIRVVGDICKNASVPKLWGLLLFDLVRQLRPSACLELGTSLGISTAYQAAALALNGVGTMMTLEGAAELARLAAQNLQRLGLQQVTVRAGRFQDTLTQALREMSPIDFALIDGHHEEKATLSYFEQMIPFLADDAVLVFDDICWTDGMRRAWDTIAADSRVHIAIDLSKYGICLLGSATKRKQYLNCSIARWRRAMARLAFR